MSLRNKFGILAVAALFAVTGCSDTIDDLTDPGGEGNLNAAEKAALINALESSGAFDGTPVSLYASLAVQTLNEVGTISANRSRAIDEAIEAGIRLAVSRAAASSYEGAVGVQVSWDFGSVDVGWFIGIVGWNGLSVQSQTVSELVAVYGYQMGSSELPPSTDASIGEDLYAAAMYWDGLTTYHGMSGSALMSGSSFSGDTDCSQMAITCSYSTGTMNGNFNFVGSDMGEPADMYTQPLVSFSGLPSVRITISGST
jgi:hypothetical protein